MPMRTAAARASSTTASPACSRASSTIAERSTGLRAAIAQAAATPHFWAAFRTPPSSTDCRFSRMSFAASGRVWRTASVATISGHLKGGLTLLPVARAELVGLQAIEDAQHLGDAAAHRQVVDAHPADHALGVHDEGGPQRDPLLLVQDAERARQLAAGVGEHGEGQALQVLVAPAPGEVDEVGVRARAQHLGAAVLEVAVPSAELRDLGRADEREVHGPVEEDEPLSREALVR